MVGGSENRDNHMYDMGEDSWQVWPKLPQKFNIACLVALNYKDKAIFTFMADGKFNIRAAVMPLVEDQ